MRPIPPEVRYEREVTYKAFDCERNCSQRDFFDFVDLNRGHTSEESPGHDGHRRRSRAVVRSTIYDCRRAQPADRSPLYQV